MQTPEGIEKFKKTMRDRYGVDANGKSLFHRQIGHAGGTAPYKGKKGFAKLSTAEVRDLAAKGGRISRRKPNDQWSDKVGG